MPWVASQAAYAFVRQMAKPRARHRRTQLREQIKRGAIGLSIEIVWTDDVNEMQRRTLRAGRALADEAKRKRLRFIGRQAPINVLNVECCEARSQQMGVALRATRDYERSPYLVRLDMLGAR